MKASKRCSPGNASLNLRGTHSSSSSRTRLAHVPSQLKCGNRLLARDGREVIQEFIEGIAALQIFIQSLDRHSRTDEDWHATQDFGVRVHDLADVYHRPRMIRRGPQALS